MNRLFITGMGRSGTSLLDKLLCAHSGIDLLSQPAPLVFIETKRRFLRAIGQAGYFVLNDDALSRSYVQEQFDSYLAGTDMSAAEIDGLFVKMRDYSGQKSRPNRESRGVKAEGGGFDRVLDYCMQFFELKAGAQFVGLKEIMCEEFLPYLGRADYKCIVILRDPRDVLASANYPRSEKFLGDKKPSLFLLRTWRKSVEFTWSLREQPFFHYLRYEDLVTDVLQELNRIADFLGVSHFDPGWFMSGIQDRSGRPWQANSSGSVQGSIVSAKSVGAYENLLSLEERAYTEAVCGAEMEWLGYLEPSVTDLESSEKCIQAFEDRGIPANPHLPLDFSSQKTQVEQELNRLRSAGRRYT